MPPRRRFLLAALLATCVPLAALAGPAAAAPKPVVCKAGTGKLTINGKARCVPRLGPRAEGRGRPVGLRALGPVRHRPRAGPGLRAALRPEAPAREGRRPREGHLAALRARIVPVGAALDAAAGVQSTRVVPGSRAARAVTTTAGPVTTTVTPGGASVTGSITTRDTANGTTGTLDITGRIRQDAAGGKDPAAELELGMTVKTDSGKSWRTEIAIPMNLTADLAERCPSATGVVRRKGGFSLRRTTRETKTMIGLDYVNETTSVTAKTSFTGQVDADAVLSSIAYDVKVDIDYAHAASALRGLVRRQHAAQDERHREGDAQRGHRRRGLRQRGHRRQRARARPVRRRDEGRVAAALAEAGFRAKMEELVASFLKTNFEALKDAETHWQTPNACAKLDLSPTTATLAADETAAVDGAISAESGEATDGKWTAKTVARGTVATLPGTSTAAQRIALTMTGAADDGGGKAVDVTLRATSPAGIAERQWTADAAASTLYFRVVAASASQSADGTLVLASSGCAFASVTSGPWTYAFAATAGPPDGAVEIDGRFLSGGRARLGGQRRAEPGADRDVPDGAAVREHARRHHLRRQVRPDGLVLRRRRATRRRCRCRGRSSARRRCWTSRCSARTAARRARRRARPGARRCRSPRCAARRRSRSRTPRRGPSTRRARWATRRARAAPRSP